MNILMYTFSFAGIILQSFLYKTNNTLENLWHENYIWLIFILSVLLVVFVYTFSLRQKQKKDTKALKEIQNTLLSLRQTLKTLTENKDEMVKHRVKALKKELKLLKQSLKSMEEALQSGQAAAKQNSLLMVKISNTLRTNLNDILGFSALLGNEFALNEETELFEYNENIRRSGEALMHLLNNIIDISKIESNSFHLHETECNLTEITLKLIEKFRPVAEQKGISIVFKETDLPPFAADEQAIQHILSNLLDNAVRYTDKGFIKISETFNGKQLVWTIKDTGMGIDKAYLPDIFEPFRQQTLGYSKTTYQGAGLGLPLIKSMLEIMGGHVEIESEKAVGTTVRVFFPFKKYITKKAAPIPLEKKQEKTAPAKKATLQTSGKRILVLDEDKLESMLIKKILSEMEVITYDNTLPAPEWPEKILSTSPLPDILLIEQDFSGKGRGPEILKHLKQHFPPLENIPAIALSAYSGVHEQDKAMQAGFAAFLRKPFRKNELISVINNLSES